jgi:predicted metal-dependent hydrolase
VSKIEYHPLYLRGIEQFNQQRYFDSHEVWEDLWIDETGPSRLFYKGLIQAAVALYHLARGNLHGADKLLEGSQRYLAPYRPWYLGLDVDGFLAAMRRCFEDAATCRAKAGRALAAPRIELGLPPDADESEKTSEVSETSEV